jgi:hypothetical protein
MIVSLYYYSFHSKTVVEYFFEYFLFVKIAPSPVCPHTSRSNVSTSSDHSTKSTDSIKTQNDNHFFIKEITENKVETVLITFVNSPSDFYLQLHDNTNTLKAVSDEVNKFVRKKQSVVQSVEMSKFLCENN